MFKYTDYVYAIYTEKSFTAAAKKLYISQPSLSLTIKKLEAELGFPVFERSGKEITTTELGQRYIDAMLEVMRIEENLECEIDDTLKLKRGRIRIGCTIFFASYILPTAFIKFKEKYPEIDISLYVEQSTLLEGMLERGEVDLIIDNSTVKNEAYSYAPLMKERILIGAPQEARINKRLASHALPYEDVKNGKCSLDDAKRVAVGLFKDEKFLLLRQGNKMRQTASRIFEEWQVSPECVMEFDHLMTSVSYAEYGFGVCFLTDTIIKCSEEGSRLCLYVPDTSHSHRGVYIIRKKNKYLTSAEKELIEFIKREI